MIGPKDRVQCTFIIGYDPDHLNWNIQPITDLRQGDKMAQVRRLAGSPARHQGLNTGRYIGLTSFPEVLRNSAPLSNDSLQITGCGTKDR